MDYLGRVQETADGYRMMDTDSGEPRWSAVLRMDHPDPACDLLVSVASANGALSFDVLYAVSEAPRPVVTLIYKNSSGYELTEMCKNSTILLPKPL